MSDAPAAPAARRGGRLPMAFWALALTYLAVAINMTVASVALPTISLAMEASTAELAWIVNATPLASAAFVLFAGAWGDRFGRPLMLRLGLVVFIVSAVLSSMATDPTQLIILRGLTGLGSALAMPAALALTFEVVDPSARRTAVGIIGATQAGGALLGPILAGVALVLGGWGWAFLVVVPLLLVALVGSWRIPTRARGDRASRMDTVGATLVAFVSVGLIYAAITASAASRSAMAVAAALVVALIALVALVVWERRFPNPIFIGSTLRRPVFWVPTLAIFTVQFVLGGLMFANTQYVQLVLGFSALGAGLFLVPALLSWIVVSATAGITARRLGSKAVTAAGLVLAAVGLMGMSTVSTSPSYPVFIVSLVLVGCMGVAPSLMTHLAVDSYPEERRTIGSAINSAATRYGLAFGVAAFSGILTGVYTARLLPALTGLTPEQGAAAEDSLGSALRTSESLAGEAAQALAAAAREAYVSGLRAALIVAGILLAVLAVIVVVGLRGVPASARSTGGIPHE